MERIYLDHAAATPLRPEVVTVMDEACRRFPGNPSSLHRWGREARSALEDARAKTAAAIGVEAGTVHFVRGGTESINLAILGRVDRVRALGASTPVLVRSALEHPAVREAMEAAENTGCVVQELPVSPEGDVDFPRSLSTVSQLPALVSVQWVNQETGMVLAIARVAERCLELGVPLHVDAVQAAGRIDVRVDRVPVAFLSISGHKLGGPRSTGVLVASEDAQIDPRIFGGGQEGGLRPGTVDVAGAVGFARALEISVERLDEESARLSRLRSKLEAGLLGALPGLRVHASEARRAPHILSIGVDDLARDLLPAALDLAGIGVSAGSACRSGSLGVSPVMRALYGDIAGRIAPVRLSLGWSSTEKDVDEAIRRIPPVIESMRNAGPPSGSEPSR